ncbi:MAG: hypothetical protein WC975_04595 [Phycisphaerae bacterium]
MTTLSGNFEYGPVGFWFLNDRLEPSAIDFQLDEFKKQGFSSVVLHPRDGLATPYLSESWFRSVEYIIQGCRIRGLRPWFYDENPFPSGSAGGMLLNRFPHLVAQRLSFTTLTAQAEEGWIRTALPGTGRLLRVFALPKDNNGEVEDVTPYAGLVADRWYVQGNRTQAYGPPFADYPCHPHWRAWHDQECWTLDWPVEGHGERQLLVVQIIKAGDSHHGDYVDLLHPETTQHFLELTYERTRQRLGPERFGHFAAAFTDEPHLTGPFPWSEILPHEYQRTYQEDILDLLPHLAMNISDQSPLVRYRYRRLLGLLWEENFIQPLSHWCQKHGLPLTGHISPEEDPILMTLQVPGWPRVMSHLDWPGYDLVLSPFGPGEAAKMLGPKLVASLAHQHGKTNLMTECLGCCGEDLTIGAMKRMIDWLAIFGFDRYVIHGQFYSLDGQRKREAPPSIFYQAPYWQHFGVLSDHIRTISEWNASGDPVRPIAVLYPISAFMAWSPVENVKAIHLAQHLGHLCGTLMGAGLDFEFVTDQDLTGAAVRESQKEFTVGQATYQTLILPAVTVLDAESINALERLQKAAIPIESLTAGISAIEPGGPAAAFPETSMESLRAKLIRKFRDWVRFPADRKLYVQSRRIDGKLERRVWNPSDEPLRLNVPDGTVTLEPWQTVILGKKSIQINPPTPAIDISAAFCGDWSLMPEEPNTLVLGRWQLQTADGSVCLVRLPTRTQAPLWDLDHQIVTLWTELIVDDPLPEAELWFDRSTFSGPYELKVNGIQVGPAEAIQRHDLHERRIAVGGLLKIGINRIEVQVGPILQGHPAVLDPLRLVGWFGVLRTDHEIPGDEAADVRPEWYKTLCDDDKSLPRVRRIDRSLRISSPQDWTCLGFPHYSGTMTYSASFAVEDRSGAWCLEFPALLTDSFQILINNVEAGTGAWTPCRLDITDKIHPGTNTLAIRVSNTSINRTGGTVRPSGLLCLPKLLMRQVHVPSKAGPSPSLPQREPAQKPYHSQTTAL